MSQTNASDASVIAKRAEVARERYDFVRSIELFDEALTLLKDEPAPAARELERWCKAHCGAACAAVGAYERGLQLFSEAQQMFTDPENIDPASAAGRAYTWILAHKGELHRLRASEELTPTRDFRRYCEEITLAVDTFRQALARDRDNPWVCVHLACTATLAYWNGFSDPHWRKAIDDAGLQDRAAIRHLFARGLAARPRDWWGRTFQVIYYVVEYPVNFHEDLRGCAASDNKARAWMSEMERWWNNYELAMALSEGLESLGMRPYTAQAGRAVATAYGLAWCDAWTQNLQHLKQLDAKRVAQLDEARGRRERYVNEALSNGLDLLRYSPEDIFGNLAVGSVLRTQYETGLPEGRRTAAVAYLSTLRKLSVTQTFITDMLRRSTLKEWGIRAGLTPEQQTEFDALHNVNSKIWELLDTHSEASPPGIAPFERATPFAHSTEQATLKNLLFPRLKAMLKPEESSRD